MVDRAGAGTVARLRPPRLRGRLLLLCALLVGPAAPALTTAVSSPPAAPVDTPTPAPGADTGEWPAGGRFVDAGYADTSTLDNRTYAQHIPPELSPSILLFQRVVSGGFQAELDFPAPVIQLRYYSPIDSGDGGDVDPSSAVPVRHTVDLVLQPPSGNPTLVSLRPDGSTVVTRGGAQIGTARTVFAGTRLIMSVPASAGVQGDWTVQAVIRLSGDQPLNAAPGAQRLPATLSTATEPAVVGALAGDSASAPEPLAGRALVHSFQVGVQSPDTQPLPSGARPMSLHLEQGARGAVAVVSLDAPPKPATTVNGNPVNQQELDLVVAPGVQDGLGVGRMRVTWSYPVCTSSPCPSAAPIGIVTLGAQYLGTVPVTVSGRDVRFDLGGFRLAPAAAQQQPQPTPQGSVLGTFTKTVTLAPEDLDVVPFAGASPYKAEQITQTIDGTSISISRASGGAPATGSINPFTGYFFAASSTEMWSGFLGKQGWYVRDDGAQPTAAHLGGGGPHDVDTPEKLDRLAQYLWTEKNEEKYGDETPGLIRWFAIAAGAPITQYGTPPPDFRHAVAQFLINGGKFDKDVLDKAFPNGFDPIVVTPGTPPPFPFAGVLPGLAPKGAQWEVAAGVTILDRTSQGIRSLSPFLPAGSLVNGSTSGGGAGASSNGPGAVAGKATGASTSGGAAGLVIALVVAVLVLAAAAAWWLRRRRAAPSA